MFYLISFVRYTFIADMLWSTVYLESLKISIFDESWTYLFREMIYRLGRNFNFLKSFIPVGRFLVFVVRNFNKFCIYVWRYLQQAHTERRRVKEGDDIYVTICHATTYFNTRYIFFIIHLALRLFITVRSRRIYLFPYVVARSLVDGTLDWSRKSVEDTGAFSHSMCQARLVQSRIYTLLSSRSLWLKINFFADDLNCFFIVRS